MRIILNLSLMMLLFLPTISIATPGDLLWENYYDREGELYDAANGVATGDNSVFVVCWTQTTVGGYAFSVRAYNTINGTLLWENHYDKERDLADWAYDVAVKDNKVFVVGSTETSAGGYAFSVRVYNTHNGALLWEDRYDREGNLYDAAWAVSISGNKVFVAGTTETSTGGYAFSVRTYNAINGTLLWENHYDKERDLEDWAWGVASSDKKVFVTGLTTTTAGYWAFSVRAFNAINGALLWEDHYNRNKERNTKEVSPGDDFWPFLNWWDWANGVTIRDSKVFVVGTTSTAEGARAFSVRVYNADDGTLLWENHYDKEGYRSDEALDVAVGGNKVFVVGMTDTTVGNDAMSVRVYNAIDGTLLWEDQYDREGNPDDWAWRMAISGSRLFVVGCTQTVTGGGAFSVRAYKH